MSDPNKQKSARNAHKYDTTPPVSKEHNFWHEKYEDKWIQKYHNE